MICFVIALESEAKPIIERMNKTKTLERFNKKLITGVICKQKAAVYICGVGKANAAAGTQFMLCEYKPDCVINIGTAGALNDKCAVGGLYGVASVVQYDFDLAELNGTSIGTLNEFSESYLRLATVVKYPLRKLATGDRFNDSKADYKLLTKDLGADLRDMECGAVAQICAHAKVPCYAFKAVSDTASSGATTEQFTKNLQLCMEKIGSEIENVVKAVTA